MNNSIFLLRLKDEQDRDAVKYLDLDTGKFECGHYFAGLRISGACFAGFEDEVKKMSFDNFETILSQEELKRLWAYDDKIHQLGYGITEGDERYKKGLKYNEEIKDIIAKLKGTENQAFFEKIQENEKEILQNEWDLTDEELQEIGDTYSGNYRDRAIVSYIYKDFDTFAEDTAESYCVIETDIQKRYFDYDAWGQDLLNNDETYKELSSGRIVMFNY